MAAHALWTELPDRSRADYLRPYDLKIWNLIGWVRSCNIKILNDTCVDIGFVRIFNLRLDKSCYGQVVEST
jgi:hypothetical protein